jgi:signal transduction histidine kinase
VNGERMEGQFIAGPKRDTVSFVGQAAHHGKTEVLEPKRLHLMQIIDYLNDELSLPMGLVNGMLKSIADKNAAPVFEHATRVLKRRIKLDHDMLAMFGDGVVEMHDRVDLHQAIDAVLLELDEKIIHANVIFEVQETQGGLPPIYGNQALLTRALYESMNNAITQSRREVKGTQPIIIRMRFVITGEYIMLSVFNRGAVLGGAKRIEVLDSYVDLHNEAITKLGLGLVQRIIGLHGGNIRVSDVDDDVVEVVLEFPTGAPKMSPSGLRLEQAQLYAEDIALLMMKNKKAW